MRHSMLRNLFSRRAASPRAPVRAPANDSSYMEFPVVLRRHVAGAGWVIAEGPLSVIMEAVACLPTERRNEFTIGFAFPSATACDQVRQEEPA
jgi:hypothetical protein